MQCKDLPDRPILEFLKDHGGIGCVWFPLEGDPNARYSRSICDVLPAGTPPKLILAKMRMLMRRGLVDGCGCGCRGDFTITKYGLNWLIPRI